MTMNVLNLAGEAVAIFFGAFVLLVFGLTFSPLVYRPKVPSGAAAERAEPGEKEAHEERGQESGGEHVHADGYIDSFAGLVSEAGGSLPLIVTVFTIGLFAWWAIYLVVNWSQYLLSTRSLWQ